MQIQKEEQMNFQSEKRNNQNVYAEKIQTNILIKQAGLKPIKELEKYEQKTEQIVEKVIVKDHKPQNHIIDKNIINPEKKIEYRTIYKADRNFVNETPIPLPPIVQPEKFVDLKNSLLKDDKKIKYEKEIDENINNNLERENKFEKEDLNKKKKIIILNEKDDIVEELEEEEEEIFDIEEDLRKKENLNSEFEINELKKKINLLVEENNRLKNKVINGEVLKTEELNFLHRSKITRKDHLANIQSKLDEKDMKLSQIKNEMNNYQKNPATMKTFLNLQNDADRLVAEKEELVHIKNTLNNEIQKNENIIIDKDQEIEKLIRDNENLKKDLTDYEIDENKRFGEETELLQKELREQEIELLRKQESIIKLEEKRRIFRQNIDNLENTNLFYDNNNTYKTTDIINYPKPRQDLVSTIEPQSNRKIIYQDAPKITNPSSYNNTTKKVYINTNNTNSNNYKRYISPEIKINNNTSHHRIYKKYIPSNGTQNFTDNFSKHLPAKNLGERERKSVYNNVVSYPLKIRRTSNIEGNVYDKEEMVSGGYKRVYLRDKSVEYGERTEGKKVEYLLPEQDEKMNSYGVFDTFRKRD